MVDRAVAVFGRTRHVGNAQRGIDGVVHGWSTITPAQHAHRHQIGAQLAQRFMTQESLGRVVGDEHARIRSGCRDQGLCQFSALGL
ncbi:hypothetical protein SDC9_125567 [bioreactor metagenome]|uniref:Uncharacterized protein n=1 Tax=bioreactor metagenome TaxID=1076179 RepID=A0A645CNF1_9ZZZZ